MTFSRTGRFVFTCVMLFYKGKFASSSDNSDEMIRDLLDFPEDIQYSAYEDKRSFEWLKNFCDFETECNVGSLHGKWQLVNGSQYELPNQAIQRMEAVPKYPALGFWSEGNDWATLYSDPLPCLQKKSGTLTVNLNTWGLWKFQVCFVGVHDGVVVECGAIARSSTLKMHKMAVKMTIPPSRINREMILTFHAAVENGVVFIEDFGFGGLTCSYELGESFSLSTINFKRYNKADGEVKNEILTPMLRRLEMLQNHIIQETTKNGTGNINRRVMDFCRAMDCSFEQNVGLCNFDGAAGSIEWKMSKHKASNTNELIAKFTPDQLGYAVLTSALITQSSYMTSSSSAANYRLSMVIFRYNKAVYNRQLIVCLYKYAPTETTCQLVEKKAENKDNTWNTHTIYADSRVNQIQIIVVQSETRPHGENSFVKIRDMHTVADCSTNSDSSPNNNPFSWQKPDNLWA